MGVSSIILINTLGYFLVIISYLLKEKYTRYIFVFFILLLSYLAMNRDLNIPDTRAYVELFKEFNGSFYSYGYEKGFLTLIEVLKYFSILNNYKILFGICSLLLFFSCSLFFNKKDIMGGLFLFNSFYGTYFSLIIIRVGFAFSFLLLSIYFKRNKILNILFFIVALFFHKSAIIFLLYYLIPEKN